MSQILQVGSHGKSQESADVVQVAQILLLHSILFYLKNINLSQINLLLIYPSLGSLKYPSFIWRQEPVVSHFIQFGSQCIIQSVGLLWQVAHTESHSKKFISVYYLKLMKQIYEKYIILNTFQFNFTLA